MDRLCALAIFLGALLLFLVQPMMGKMILPWFGGTPAVWTTCMLFFQLLLLGGYAYAAIVTRMRNRNHQAILHVSLLTIGVCLLPITPGMQWKPIDGQYPAWRILTMLAVCVGWPYFLLSATSPLVQSWFSRLYPGRSPYRLYALSNAGSLGSLLAYPFLIEPAISTSLQGWLWSAAYVLFAAVLASLAWQMRSANDAHKSPASSTEQQPPESNATPSREAVAWRDRLLWLALSALPSTMLLAVTNHLCQDVAVVPFLWILPLALYLLSLIICFERDRWIAPVAFSLLAIVAILIACDLDFLAYMGTNNDLMGNRFMSKLRFNILFVISVYLTLFFAVCMVCHGEIVRRRPPAARLTEFYLILSAGGALGGILVAIVCPVIFTTYAELKLCLLISFAIAVFVFLRDGIGVPWLSRYQPVPSQTATVAIDQPTATANLPRPERTSSRKNRTARAAAPAKAKRSSSSLMATLRGSAPLRNLITVISAVLMVVVVISQTLSGELAQRVETMRNFYGTLSIKDWIFQETRYSGRGMYHGSILHGYQLMSEELMREPTTYYTRDSGVGVALASLREDASPERANGLHVGVVGLGAGTMAAYAQAGDKFRFYEINPLVIELARSRFTFLSDAAAEIEIVPGDARLSLEREPPQGFDLLVLDAFSGDSIPVHLLTRQAIDIYLTHLEAGGLIAIHTSNRHVDLRKVITQLAVDRDLFVAMLEQNETTYMEKLSSEWMLLARSTQDLSGQRLRQFAFAPQLDPQFAVWTDDYNNLFRVIRTR